jgi:hypothetical protein
MKVSTRLKAGSISIQTYQSSSVQVTGNGSSVVSVSMSKVASINSVSISTGASHNAPNHHFHIHFFRVYD